MTVWTVTPAPRAIASRVSSRDGSSQNIRVAASRIASRVRSVDWARRTMRYGRLELFTLVRLTRISPARKTQNALISLRDQAIRRLIEDSASQREPSPLESAPAPGGMET